MRARRSLLLALLAVLALLPVHAAAATPVPALVLAPASGPAGTTTTVTGTGMPASTKGTLTVGRSRLSVRTSSSGTFEQAVLVPSTTPAGPLSVRADVGRATALATFTVGTVSGPPPRLAFGVSMPGGFYDRGIGGMTTLAGEAPTIELAFTDATRAPDLTGLRNVAARGATPLLTLEPWQAGAGVSQPAYSLDAIAAGAIDPLLRDWAAAFAAFDRPVLLRFAHEMNGDWYPWAEGVNGNGPGDYAAAWRHVHAVVEPLAPKVEWVWAPNVPYLGSTPLDGLFPGEALVDRVALDGYNFGTSQSWSSWVAPAALFDAGLAELRRLSDREVLVTETASSELGGSKADWNRALVSYLAAQPDVVGFVWFHHDKETDWRIDSSASSASALREGLAARRS